ncbi:hypothetical protein IWW51_004253 [Coemansia sp. RSA 2702]|nr:hypothetical protein IWW51_004253 [Coemansia sp. RSA 2702]
MSLPFNAWRAQGQASQLGIDDPMSNDPGLFHLSRTERLMAFGACFVLGMVLSIIGTILIFSGHMAAFAVCYSIGNVVSLFGMGFLVGFKKQLKMATAPYCALAWYSASYIPYGRKMIKGACGACAKAI